VYRVRFIQGIWRLDWRSKWSTSWRRRNVDSDKDEAPKILFLRYVRSVRKSLSKSTTLKYISVIWTWKRPSIESHGGKFGAYWRNVMWRAVWWQPLGATTGPAGTKYAQPTRCQRNSELDQVQGRGISYLLTSSLFWWMILWRTVNSVLGTSQWEIGKCVQCRSQTAFAVDVALIAKTEQNLQFNLNVWQEEISWLNMDINAQKTKTMVISRNPVQHTIRLVGQQLEQVKSSNTLRLLLARTGRLILK
jgi:hypothetical protein